MERRDEREAISGFFKDERDSSGREARTNRRRPDERPFDGERRKSFNPNFNRDNSLRRQRNYGEDDRRTYSRKGGYDNEAESGEVRFNDRRRGGFRESEGSRTFNRNGNRYNNNRDNNRGGYRGRNEDNERSFDRETERDNFRERRFDRSQDRGGRFERGDREGFGNRRRGNERKDYGNRREGSFGGDRKRRPRITKEEYTPEVAFTAEPLINRDIRLNRYIAMSGICSRREADSYITSGAISVNGVVVTELGTKIKPGDEVRFNDEVIRGEKKVYIVMNKPKGFVTTVDDPNSNGHTVMDILGDKVQERIYPVGRLDKQTMGVLLFTNDGDLTRELTHPSYGKKKIYHVFLDKNITEEDMEKLASGVELEDGIAFADEIHYTGTSKKEIGIEIHNGRNRIVRRMLESLGYKVTKLDRVYFAGLTKKGLQRGFWRYLTEKEVTALKSGMYK